MDSYYDANMIASPFDASDSEKEKNYASNSNLDMSSLIQKEVTKEVARILKGKGKVGSDQ